MSTLPLGVLTWAKALRADRWFAAGVTREARSLAHKAGVLAPTDAWKLGWSAMFHDSLSDLTHYRVTDVLLDPRWRPNDPLESVNWTEWLQQLPQPAEASIAVRNWLAVAQRSHEGSAEGNAWAAMVGSHDRLVALAYTAAFRSDYSYFLDLGALRTDDWENMVLELIERLPTSVLLSKNKVFEAMGATYYLEEIKQEDRWAAVLERHQAGLEQWLSRTTDASRRFDLRDAPRSWLWLLDRVLEQAPGLVDRPECVPTVFMASAAAKVLRSLPEATNTGTRLNHTHTLDAIYRAMHTLPLVRTWALGAPENVVAWMNARDPDMPTKLRAAALERGIPGAISGKRVARF